MKLIGMLLIMLGTVGWSFSYIVNQKKRIILLQEWSRVCALLSREIIFSQVTLQEACYITADRTSGTIRKFLLKVSERMKLNQGITLEKVWQEEWKMFFYDELLSKEEQSLLIRLPDKTGYADYRMQEQELLRYKDELDEQAKKLEEGFEGKRRIVLSFGILGGLFSIILFL